MGLVFDFFIIWGPDPSPEINILNQAKVQRELIEEHIKMGLWSKEKHDLLRRLIPFGTSENGDVLAWDSDSSNDDKEMDIYLLDNEQSDVVLIGSSIQDFLRNCLNGKLDEVFPLGEGRKWDFPEKFKRLYPI